MHVQRFWYQISIYPTSPFPSDDRHSAYFFPISSLLSFLYHVPRPHYWTTWFLYSCFGLKDFLSESLLSFPSDISHNSFELFLCRWTASLFRCSLMVHMDATWHCEWRRILCVSSKSTEKRLSSKWAQTTILDDLCMACLEGLSKGVSWGSFGSAPHCLLFVPKAGLSQSYPLCFAFLVCFGILIWISLEVSPSWGQCVLFCLFSFLGICILWSGYHGVDWFSLFLRSFSWWEACYLWPFSSYLFSLWLEPTHDHPSRSLIYEPFFFNESI